MYKMGWKTGRGLGRNEDGIKSPIILAFSDRRNKYGIGYNVGVLTPEGETQNSESHTKSAKSQSTITTPVSGNEGDALSFLKTLPQFQILRQDILKNPMLIYSFLQEIGKSNPQLLQLIFDYYKSFISMLKEPLGTQGSNPCQGSSNGADTGTGSAETNALHVEKGRSGQFSSNQRYFGLGKLYHF